MKKIVALILAMLMIIVLCSCDVAVNLGNTTSGRNFGVYCCVYEGEEYYVSDSEVYHGEDVLFEAPYPMHITADSKYLYVITEGKYSETYDAPFGGPFLYVYDLEKGKVITDDYVLSYDYENAIAQDGKLYYTDGDGMCVYDANKGYAESVKDTTAVKGLELFQLPFKSSGFDEYGHWGIAQEKSGRCSIYDRRTLMVGDKIVELESSPGSAELNISDGTSYSLQTDHEYLDVYTDILPRDGKSIFLISQQYSAPGYYYYDLGCNDHIKDTICSLNIADGETKRLYESEKGERIIGINADNDFFTATGNSVYRIVDGSRIKLASYHTGGDVWIELCGRHIYIFSYSQLDQENNKGLIAKVDID